jgi:hypothetical protein
MMSTITLANFNESVVEYNKFGDYMSYKKANLVRMLNELTNETKSVEERLEIALNSKVEILELINDLKFVSSELIEKGNTFRSTLARNSPQHKFISNTIDCVSTYIEKNSGKCNQLLLSIELSIMFLKNCNKY